MSLNLVSLVLLLIAKSHVIKLCQSVCQTSISDLTLKNHVIFSFSTADLNDCWHRCQSETRCQSLNFFTKHNLCEINNRTIELAANEDTAQTQFTAYFENPYRVPVGTAKEVSAVSCAEILKTVGRVSGRYWFVDHARSRVPFMAYCNMTTVAMEDCAVGQCKNNGTCTYLGSGNYQCACQAQYSGKDCEIKISVCNSSPCQNNGTCIDHGNTFKCNCLYNSIGTRCQTACRSTPALGMESKTIPDSHITTSSNYNSQHGGFQARLNNKIGSGAWVSGVNAVGEWIQVNIGIVTTVTGIATQGRDFDRYWVTSYSVQYRSYDALEFTDYEGGRVFNANTERFIVVRNNFSPSINASYIRVIVRSWHTHIALRMELYGCFLPPQNH